MFGSMCAHLCTFLSHQSTRERSSKDNIVVEMKSDNTEEAILLGVNGEKQARSDQVELISGQMQPFPAHLFVSCTHPHSHTHLCVCVHPLK